jgi:hypothetical protein
MFCVHSEFLTSLLPSHCACHILHFLLTVLLLRWLLQSTTPLKQRHYHHYLLLAYLKTVHSRLKELLALQPEIQLGAQQLRPPHSTHPLFPLLLPLHPVSESPLANDRDLQTYLSNSLNPALRGRRKFGRLLILRHPPFQSLEAIAVAYLVPLCRSQGNVHLKINWYCHAFTNLF